MLLSSCVVWRHLDCEDFRAECPGGDEALQRLIWERLDDALAWLVSLGAEPVWEDTENPRTTGKRFDPRALTELLARDVELETPLPEDVERAARARDRRLPGAAGGRARAPAAREPVERRRRARPRDVRAAPAVTGGHGRVLRARDAGAAGADPRGGLRPALAALRRAGRASSPTTAREITPASVAWHENDLAQRLGPSAWYVVARGLERARSSRARARRAERSSTRRELPFETPPGTSPCTSPPRSRTRSAASASTRRAARRRRRRALGRRRRRRRRRDRRLRERPGAGARARARRGGRHRLVVEVVQQRALLAQMRQIVAT